MVTMSRALFSSYGASQSISNYNMMAGSVEPENGILILGVAVAFFVLLALVTQYFELPSSLQFDKISVAPYLRFAYVSFIKPHTGQVDQGQQSALESFYAAQVSSFSLPASTPH